MKKLVFMFVAVAAISFASCGNKTAANEGQQDTDTIPVPEVAVPTAEDSAKALAAVIAEIGDTTGVSADSIAAKVAAKLAEAAAPAEEAAPAE